jgi:hypothetical protein
MHFSPHKYVSTFLILLLLIISSSCHVFQKRSPLKEGKHYKNKKLEQYVGNWINVNEKDTIELELIFYKHYIVNYGAYRDALKGELKFPSLEANSIKTVSVGPAYRLDFLGKKKKTKGFFNFQVYDQIKGKNGYGVLEFEYKNDTIAFWRMVNLEHTVINGVEQFDPSWSIPDSLYLTKVK